MFSFLISASVGALFGGSYVLLRTPRTGKENQEVIKQFYYDTKADVEDVQDKASNVQASLNQLKVEVTKLQTGVVPELMHTADDFKVEAQVYSRRINDEVEVLKSEFDQMQKRIEARTDKLPVEKVTQKTNSSNK